MKLFVFAKSWSFRIVNNYFLLLALNGLLLMMGMISIAKFDLLIMLAATVITISYLSKGVTKFDLFIILFIAVVALSGLLNNYSHELWYQGCRSQLYFTIFFFVGRHPQIANLNLFRVGVLPFLSVCIIGLGLYIMSPSWYMDYKLQMFQTDEDMSEGRILEMTRLSAFWTYPYWVSYGCAIMYAYIMINCYMKGFMKREDAIILIFFAFIALLTQQRAPLFTIASLTIVFILFGLFKRKRIGHISLRTSILYFISLVVCMFMLFLTMIHTDMLSRLLEKIELLENISMFLNDRADIFSDFYSKKISLFGDGIGRYSHTAYNLGKQAITDQQYMQLIYETGYLGCIGYAIIIMTVLFKGLKYYSSFYLELTIIAFFLVAMTGANCLSSFNQHIAIFWMCCGRICNKYLVQHYKAKKPSLQVY